MAHEINVTNVTKVKGLFYIEDIKEDTTHIISKLDTFSWQPLSASKISRVVQHYGFKYNYHTYKINERCNALPECLTVLKNMLTDTCLQLGLIDANYEFNQCIVNNYYAGQGISPHIDVPTYGEVIGCFTIGSGATMKFTHGSEEVDLYVNRDSLYIMSGDSRFKWKHSMTSKKSDIVNDTKIERARRVSITFRNVPN